MTHPTPIPHIDRVAVVGATHGNEITGATLVERWLEDPTEVTRPEFETLLLLANTAARGAGKRYLVRDLNRSFQPEDLANPALNTGENARAKEIAALLGPRDNPAVRCILDLHTTTSNMGTTLITDASTGGLLLADEVRKRLPGARVYSIGRRDRSAGCLRAVAPLGLGIEVGPIPQGVLRHDVLDATRAAANAALDVLAEWKRVGPPRTPTVEAYALEETVRLPLDERGRPAAVIHRDLEGGDWRELRPGDALFQRFDGQVVCYDGPAGRCPIFVNEAAYYDNFLAFSLVRETTLATGQAE